MYNLLMEYKRHIDLPSGADIDFTYTEKFVKEIRRHFNLGPKEKISDNHIRMYITESLKSGMKKIENENSDTSDS